MTQFVELEISLERMAESMRVALRFDRSDSEADVAPVVGLASFDLAALRAVAGDRKQYGLLLAQSLFADPKIKAAFEKGCVMAESLEMPLRVRLTIDKSAVELHSVAPSRHAFARAEGPTFKVALTRVGLAWRAGRRHPPGRLFHSL